MAREVVGFLSYAGADDAHAEGRVSELREVLEAEVRAHGVSGFHLFQDKTDIRGGDEWKRMIVGRLEASAYFVPLLSPTFFEREWCRFEAETFLARPEVEAGRAVIFPLYFVDDPEYNDDDWREDDALRVALHRFHHRDLRELRHEGFRAGEGRKRVARLGQEIAQRLNLLHRQEAAAAAAEEYLRARNLAEAGRAFRKGKLVTEAEACAGIEAKVAEGDWAAALAAADGRRGGWADEGWEALGLSLEAERVREEVRRVREAQSPEEARRAAGAYGDRLRQPGHRHRIGLPGAVGLDLVWIPEGSFPMGSPEDFGPDHEHPQHEVRITRPFWLGRTPVTQAEWAAVVRAGRGRTEAAGLSEAPSYFVGAVGPVERVSWLDAVQWCNLASLLKGRTPAYRLGSAEPPEVERVIGADGFRLPTEAEWEYACRAGTVMRWSCSDDEAALARYAWFGEGSGGATHAVGEKAPNPWGLHDMHGNVSEWCDDWFDLYPWSGRADPVGPPRGLVRVVRGGSFQVGADRCRSGFRSWRHPTGRDRTQGFRLLLPPPPYP